MKVKDGIIGLVVGDALGVPFEFTKREVLQKTPIMEMIGFGTYGMPAGTFSDDSSMTIATMASIVNNGGEIDYGSIMEEFLNWWKFSKYTQYDDTFDMGMTTLKALHNFDRGIEPLESGLKGERDNGNGSLMRILPLAFIGSIDYKTVENVSSLTHAHIISKISCVFYVELAKSVLSNNLEMREHIKIASEKIKEIYKDNDELNHFKRIIDGSIYDDDLDTIESSGYVLATLESVVYVLGNTDSYREAVLKAVNLGSDTDTVGAITGGIAGLYYGFDEIPNDWIETVKDSDKIIDLCEKYEKVIN